MIDLLDNLFKRHILERWEKEVVYNQRVLLDLMFETHKLRWYDEQVWEKIVDTLIGKKRINAYKDFQKAHQTLTYMNEDTEHCKLAGTLGEKIDAFMAKHYTEDRQWKYCDKRRMERPLQELVDRREEAKLEDYKQLKAATDQRIIIQAREAEKKLKRLKMAKYSIELLDEIIAEMMREKKTVMEMMAELDVDDTAVYASQTRIAKKTQRKNIEEQLKKAGK